MLKQLAFAFLAALSAPAMDMAVLMPAGAAKDPEWRKVGEALVAKYPGEARAFTVDWHVAETLPALRKLRPRHLVLVAPPEQISRNLVYDLNRLTRKLDDDPYGDCLWGIITGYTPADALRTIAQREPLVLRRGLGTTGFDTGLFDEAMFLSDGQDGVITRRTGGKNVDDKREKNDEGLAFEFRKFWEQEKPQFLVTSSHATQYNLEMPFGNGLLVSYANRFHVLRRDQLPGFARFLGGVIFQGREADLKAFLEKEKPPVLADSSAVPKVWNGAGNCLLGDTRRSRNSMVVTAMSSGGVRQLIGYTVTTWYGNMGWGSFGRFLGSRGRDTFAESFFFTNQALLDDSIKRDPKILEVEFNDADIEAAQRNPEFAEEIQRAGIKVDKDVLGLIHDRDVVAFFGDPRWEARVDGKAHPPALQVAARRSAKGIDLQLEAGPDYKGDGFDWFFPAVIPAPKLEDGDGVDALLTDDFILVRKTPLKPGEKRILRIVTAAP
ncbi:MAG: hypothetical protein U1F77_13610 [Kiritimatiellia bacterium]